METSLPPALADIVILPAEPIPVSVHRSPMRISPMANLMSPLTRTPGKSFDFTGEIRMLNESGASERRSFVEQFENAFRTPARIDSRYSFPDSTTDVPPLPTLATDIQDSSTSTTGLSATVDDFQMDEKVNRTIQSPPVTKSTATAVLKYIVSALLAWTLSMKSVAGSSLVQTGQDSITTRMTRC